jgi:hypothetical protein
MTSFADMLAAGYGFTDPAITLGAALEGGAVHPEPKVRVPVAMMNRHGLVAGATGTGKTRTLQLLAEQLSAHGVPVFVADIKGDLGGLAMPGEASDRVTGRSGELKYDWKAGGVPVEFVSLHRGARRPAPGDGQLLRSAASGQGALAERGPRPACSRWSSEVRRRRAASPRPVRLRAVLQFLSPTRESGAGGLWRHVKATVGVLLRSWWSWRPRARAVLRRAGVRCPRHAEDHVRRPGGVVTCLELAGAQDKPALFSRS